MELPYVILKREEGNISLAASNFGGSPDSGDFIEFATLTSADVEDIRRNPEREAILSVPYALAEPVDRNLPCNSHWAFDAIRLRDSPGGDGLKVAILDTGIDDSHAAFNRSRLVMCDFTEDPKGIPELATDTDGHGTHCAGTLFGHDVDGQRIGIARNVEQAFIAKILCGGKYSGTTEAILSAILWAINNGAEVISMSFGIDYPGMVKHLREQFDLPEAAAVSIALAGYRDNVRLFESIAKLADSRDAMGHGCVLVAAGGNESRRAQIPKPYTVQIAPPATSDGFLSVAAVRKTDLQERPYEIASFSNTGARIAAPGVDICSARLGGGLVSMSGTSMATPISAGIAVLHGQQIKRSSPDRNWWARKVCMQIESTSQLFPGLAEEDVGMGIVQAPAVR